MTHRIFTKLQGLGKTFMLPIALLPIAGLMLGVGASFSSNAFLEMYHLHSYMGEGTFIFRILAILRGCGAVIFANLPILFACAVALGLAKKAKEVAALSAIVAYFMMHAAISNVIHQFEMTQSFAAIPGLLTNTLGFEETLNTGVFGGIAVGIMVAALHNKTMNIELPDALSFFSGTRFVPIISSTCAIVLGIAFIGIWPTIASGISSLGRLIAGLGVFGTFIYGYIFRALIPLGLHHVFYLPFWQTSLGGSAVINGTLVEGAQNLVFAQLAAGQVVNPEYARFFSGMFPFMIFGFPAAAIAMVKAAKPEHRERVKGLMISASLTSFFTGITEPIEFAFLFASPFLYFGIHCILAASSFAILHLLHVGVGVTFSGGALDFLLYGILPGSSITNFWPVIFVGIAYGFIYYFAFKFMIKKFDLKTPGREEGLVGDAHGISQAQIIVEGLGGVKNIEELDNCATRLRIVVHDANSIDQEKLKLSQCAGIIVRSHNCQLIFGPQVPKIKLEVENFIESLEK